MKPKIVVLFVVTFVITGLMCCGCGKKTYSKLEEEMTTLASNYYEEQLKGVVLGFNEHQVSLEMMEKVGYNINNFINKNCDKSSYSVIKLTLNEDREVIGDYEVENYLTCKKYESENKK